MTRDPGGCANAGVEEGEGESSRRLQQTLTGFVFVANGYLLEWFIPGMNSVAGISCLVGSLILAGPILWTSVKDLARGRVSINELVSLAVLASFATGDYKTAGVVSFFMLLGEIIETRTAAGARASIEALVQLTPTRALKLVNGNEQEVQAAELKAGDLIRIRPGDNIPADGVVRSGSSALNQASITGESLPVDSKPGDTVFAGTINLTGVLDVEVTRAGGETTLGRVRELILAAEQTRLPVSRLIDNYMGYYTPLVLTLAAVVWLFSKDLNRVISVLVVACPCAFVLATPSAMVAALSAAARLGILIKNLADLELAARLTAFIFDKTGTVTTGKLTVARLSPKEGFSASELLQAATSAERHSTHPVARALRQLADEVEVPLIEPEEFKETAGRGVSAVLRGATVLVGRSRWLADQGIAENDMRVEGLDETEGFSLLHVARDGVAMGWIAFQDQGRPEAVEVVAELKRAGIERIALVTGDRHAVAVRVAREIGCDELAADCLPQDKVDCVRRMREAGGVVAVVGDGVNDAPALASGDIGIAMGAAGSEAAIHSASIALMNNDLRRLPFLISLSKETRRVIHHNFLIGFVFILGGLLLATLGYLNPIIAAVLHNAGSLMVVFNSARLVRQGEEFQGVINEVEGETTSAEQSHRWKSETNPNPA